MRRLAASCALVLVGAALLAACAKERVLACERDQRYGDARSADALQIPNDLSLPNEQDALVIPSVPIEASAGAGCLETPPEYFEGFQEQRVAAAEAAAAVDEPSRRERRRARREAEEAAEAAGGPAGTGE